MKLKIKKGDQVQVISGNDRGKTGRVLLVNPSKMTVLVEGINIQHKHQKPSQKNQKGGIVELEMPLHYSNVLLIDSDKNPTRTGIRVETIEGRRKAVRFARTNGKDL